MSNAAKKQEPLSYTIAAKDPKWVEAMNEESEPIRGGLL